MDREATRRRLTELGVEIGELEELLRQRKDEFDRLAAEFASSRPEPPKRSKGTLKVKGRTVKIRKRSSTPKMIREYFDKHPDAQVTVNELIEAGVGGKPDNIRSACHRMVGKGILENPETGIFTLKAKEGQST